MTKEEGKIKVDGLVNEALPGTQFRVKLDNGHEVLAYLSGKMRKHYIRILLGDRVALEMSPYDMARGRIPSVNASKPRRSCSGIVLQTFDFP